MIPVIMSRRALFVPLVVLTLPGAHSISIRSSADQYADRKSLCGVMRHHFQFE